MSFKGKLKQLGKNFSARRAKEKKFRAIMRAEENKVFTEEKTRIAKARARVRGLRRARGSKPSGKSPFQKFLFNGVKI